MRTYRLGDLATLQQGSLGASAGSTYGNGSYGGAVYGAQDSVVADSLFDAQAGQPALIPAPQWSAAAWLATTDSRFAYAGTWSGAQTTTPNSSVTLTFWGYGAIVYLAVGALAGIAWVTMDGAPYPAVDSALAQEGPLDPQGGGATAALTLIAPAGGQHVVVLTYYGDIDAAVASIGVPTNTVGSSVAALLLPSRANRGATTTATWTVKALDSSHVSVNGSGSYALGTTVTGVVAGVNLALASGTMTTGDTATFTTSATGITLQGAYVAPMQASGGSYTTPLVASDGTLPLSGGALPLPEPGADRAPIQWLCAAWEEDPAHPVTAGSAATGNTLNPSDAAWATTPAADGFSPTTLAIAHDGAGHGYMGLAVLPRGAYCQATVDPPADGYVRNLRLYGWDPDADPDRGRFPPVPGDDLALRLYGALATAWAVVERDPMRELLASCSVGGAVGAYLDRHGAEWELPRPFGLTDALYAQLLRFLSTARTQGGTLGFFQKALGLLLGPDAHFSIQSLAGTTVGWVLGTSALGVDTVLGSYTPGAWQAQVTIQVASLTIPPQLVVQVIEAFRPVGVEAIYVWD